MTAALSNYFQSLLSTVDGALAFLITDRSGVPIVKVLSGKCPESATRGSFLSTFATATEQASKLGLSNNKRMICMYPSYQVVMFNYVPLVVTIIGSSSTNTGLLLEMESDFVDVIDKLKSSVVSKNQ
ncbi:ragulator complex protein LAMTOR3-A-like [Hydractinia symbiolongicarpus]|uniref:ragulator complex protein LAMTOR3-A-like n=1 Tax=Hydractinia symbiolongicarpus TaxID=13093 RepID=UPI002551B099|nr:ragulator complex protein LAMTOR3-A-like [Hydractinia symbiolongicarpus]XP_057298198.1 ragulator complex protein LAMTOR3-A-like [Hydractinia symbiolongicarpus]